MGLVGLAPHDAGYRLGQNILSALVLVRPCQPITRADGIDELRVALFQRLIAEPHTLHHARAEVVDDDIRLIDQRQHACARILPFQIQRQTALVAVERAEDRILRPSGSEPSDQRERSPIFSFSILMTSAP